MEKKSTAAHIGNLLGFTSIEECNEVNIPLTDPNDILSVEQEIYELLHGYPEKLMPFIEIIEGTMTFDEKFKDIYDKCKYYFKLPKELRPAYLEKEGKTMHYYHLLKAAKEVLKKEAQGKVYDKSFTRKL